MSRKLRLGHGREFLLRPVLQEWSALAREERRDRQKQAKALRFFGLRGSTFALRAAFRAWSDEARDALRER